MIARMRLGAGRSGRQKRRQMEGTIWPVRVAIEQSGEMVLRACCFVMAVTADSIANA
mgnify:CR=1 FL=1